jgi:hypothetical protein
MEASMSSLDARAVAAHVICSLGRAQKASRAVALDDLAAEIGVRRGDVREIVIRLHLEGHVDAHRLRLTMSGLALAAALDGCLLKDPRREMMASRRVA